MAISLGVHTIFSSAFSFSSLAPGIYTAAKPAKLINTLGVNTNSFRLGVFSIASTIALGFLSDNTGFQTNPAFGNGVSIWKPPSSLHYPTATLMPSSTPTLISPECQHVRTKGILAAFTTICAFLVGSAYVMHLSGTSSQNFSSSSEPARENQRSAQPDRSRDPAPWPLPPQSRRPSGSQPPNRSSGSTGGRPRRGKTHYKRRLTRPFREDPPPPPPPSLAGFIQDFPKPQNFEEFVLMNILFGAICGWILKKLIGYLYGGKAQRTKIVSSSLPKRAATAIPKKTGDRLRHKISRSRLPERRQTTFPLQPQRSSHPFPLFLIFTLAGSGSLVLFGFKARFLATNVQHGPNQHNVPPMVVHSRNRNSVHYKHNSPADTSHLNMTPRSQSTPPNNRQELSLTRRSPSGVRHSKTEHVRYFYKDEIIGFENGPRPRGRSSSVS